MPVSVYIHKSTAFECAIPYILIFLLINRYSLVKRLTKLNQQFEDDPHFLLYIYMVKDVP